MLQGNSLRHSINDYIVNYSAEANLSPKTVKNKQDILKRLPDFLGDQPLNLQTCRAFIEHMFATWKTPNSRLDLIRVLRAFVNFLHKYKYISENFAQDLIKPKVPKKEFDYVDPEIVEKIIIAGTESGKEDNSRNKNIKIEMRAALRFILRTGIRINELLLLRRSDLNLYDNPPTFWVNSKGGDRELLPLPKDMLRELEERTKNGRVFAVTEKTCNDVLQRGAKALGLSVHLTNHSLRHIFATNLVKHGVSIALVSRLLRHSSVEITDKTYTHLNVNDLSLVINSTQSIVVNGLTHEQVFYNIEEAVKNTGVLKDKRFSVSFERNNNTKELYIKIEYE